MIKHFTRNAVVPALVGLYLVATDRRTRTVGTVALTAALAVGWLLATYYGAVQRGTY